MPKETSSPFTPGQPVSVEAFVGREEELRLLDRKAARVADGNLEVVFLSGERGIGKTSLARYILTVAERHHGLIGAHVYLGGVRTIEEVVRRSLDGIVKNGVDQPWYKNVAALMGRYVRKVGLFDVTVEFQAPPEELGHLVRNFGSELGILVEKAGDDRKGIFLVWDDINGIAGSLDFANWLKSLVDGIATSRRPVPMLLMLLGYDERRYELISLQQSLSRVFTPVEIPAWPDEKTREFYVRAFANVDMTVEDDALRAMVEFTGGLPTLAHEIGDAAFNLAPQDTVGALVSIEAIAQAAEAVGRKYLDPQVYKAIRSEKYRSILRKIVGPEFAAGFKRREVMSDLDAAEQRVFDSFLKRMRELGVLRQEGEAGTYNFVNRLHWLYFRMQSVGSLSAGDILP